MDDLTKASENDTSTDPPFLLLTSPEYLTKLTPDIDKRVIDEKQSDDVFPQSQPPVLNKTEGRGIVFPKRYAHIEAYDAEMERLEYLKYSNEHSESMHGRQRKHKEQWSPSLRRVLPKFNIQSMDGDCEENN